MQFMEIRDAQNCKVRLDWGLEMPHQTQLKAYWESCDPSTGQVHGKIQSKWGWLCAGEIERERVIYCSSLLQMLSLLLFSSEVRVTWVALSPIGKALFTTGRCWSSAMDRLIRRKRGGRRCCDCCMAQEEVDSAEGRWGLSRCCLPLLHESYPWSDMKRLRAREINRKRESVGVLSVKNFTSCPYHRCNWQVLESLLAYCGEKRDTLRSPISKCLPWACNSVRHARAHCCRFDTHRSSPRNRFKKIVF